MAEELDLNNDELRRYLKRVGERWPIERAIVGGARVDDLKGAYPQRERGPEYIVILISDHFSGVPWLERVYQAGSLWDALEMGDEADVHCYTSEEFERKSEQIERVSRTVTNGIELQL